MQRRACEAPAGWPSGAAIVAAFQPAAKFGVAYSVAAGKDRVN